jgi:hypothetical protein
VRRKVALQQRLDLWLLTSDSGKSPFVSSDGNGLVIAQPGQEVLERQIGQVLMGQVRPHRARYSAQLLQPRPKLIHAPHLTGNHLLKQALHGRRGALDVRVRRRKGPEKPRLLRLQQSAQDID